MTTPPPSRRLVASSAPATLLLLLLTGAADAAPPLVGVSSQDEAYFAPQVIACRDGSGSFPRSRLNDGYCDCADGTDEPGTSACPEGKFYCRNTGDTPRFLFSSFVNDKICGRDGKNSRLFIRCTCQIIKQPLSYGCTRFGFAFNAAPVLHLPPNFCNVLACLGRHGPQILIFHSNYKLQILEYGNVVADHGPFSIRLSSSLQGL